MGLGLGLGLGLGPGLGLGGRGAGAGDALHCPNLMHVGPPKVVSDSSEPCIRLAGVANHAIY